jgi:DNA-binding LacI/PurR family transcriptional regulator
MSPSRPRDGVAPRATIADVARLARVDPSVVSRVINSDDRLVIKEETRARVLDAIRELRYHPNAAARSLRTSQSGTFGLLIPDFTNPIYAEIITGAERAATERNALLLVGSAIENRPERYVEMLASGRVDGLMLATDMLRSETIEAMTRTGRPLVSVNQRIKGVKRTILADDEGASRIAVRHLFELGHRRIAHLRGPETSDTAKRRLAGYRKALASCGIPATDAVVLHGGYTTESGVSGIAEMLALKQRPTAMVIANIAAAVGAMSALREAGLQVPDDISVIAIHDISLAAHLAPALTTVSMPLAEMGAAGVAALSGDGTDGTTVVKKPTELIERRSTAPLRVPARSRS